MLPFIFFFNVVLLCYQVGYSPLLLAILSWSGFLFVVLLFVFVCFLDTGFLCVGLFGYIITWKKASHGEIVRETENKTSTPVSHSLPTPTIMTAVG